MRVSEARVFDAAEDEGRVRIAAEVTYDDGMADTYWFEVDGEFRSDLSATGNPWLALLLPLALTIREPLEIAAPVDPVLYEGAYDLMHVWHAWNPALPVVPIKADVLPDAPRVTIGKTASFFSGGVDSFFTVLRHEGNRTGAALHIDELLFFWRRIKEPRAYARALQTVREAAAELGKTLVAITTNVDDTRWARTNWPRLTHGSFMGAVALLLGQRYNTVMIASTGAYPNLRPWGSHPLTDPLLSSSRLRLVHDGAFATRLEKLRLVALSDVALRHLLTCWISLEGDNCSVCSRCYRVMAALEALNVLDRAETFRGFRVERLAGMYTKPTGMPYMRELEALARSANKPALARAVRSGMRYSRRRHVLLPALKWLQQRRYIWRHAELLEKRLLAQAALQQDPVFIQRRRKAAEQL